MVAVKNNEKMKKKDNNLVLCISNLPQWKFILENKH